VDRVDDPVDARVTADGLVLGVHEDDLVVLVGRVLVDPVGVQDTQVSAAATNTLLSGRAQGALVFQLVNTLVGGFACRPQVSPDTSDNSRITRYHGKDIHTVGSTLRNRLLASSTANTHTVDDVALLGLVAETASLVGARWARSTVDDIELTELY
jgi:hypothetical protein